MGVREGLRNQAPEPFAQRTSEEGTTVGPGGGVPPDLRRTQVLVVGHEAKLSHLYASWLGSPYETKVVSSVDAAAAILSNETVDILVLDHQTLVRNRDHALFGPRRGDDDCQTVLLTPVESAEFRADDYVSKPVCQETLLEAVEEAREVALYEDVVDETVSLLSRRRKLERHCGDDRLGQSEELARVSERIEALQACLDDRLADAESEYVELLRRGKRQTVLQTSQGA